MPTWLLPLAGQLITILGIAIVFGRRDGETRTQIQSLTKSIEDLTKVVGEKQSKSEMLLQVELWQTKLDSMDRLHVERLDVMQRSLGDLRQIIATSHHRLRGDLMILSTGGKLRTEDAGIPG